MLVKSKRAPKKFIARGFYITKTDDWTISVSFCTISRLILTLAFTFEIEAHSWEHPDKILLSRLGLDSFFKLFRFKKLPYISKDISSSMLKEYFQEPMNSLLAMIHIQKAEKKEDLGHIDSSLKGLSPRSPLQSSRFDPESMSGRTMPQLEMKLILPVNFYD